MCEKALDDVVALLVLAEKPQGLRGALLASAITVRWVTIRYEELKFAQRRHLAPREEFEEFALLDGVVEVLSLRGALANLGEHPVNVRLGIFRRPCAPALLVADIDDIPVVGKLASAYDAAVLSDDVTAPDYQEWLGDRACTVYSLLPPVPFFLEYDGVLTVGVGVKVIGIDDIGAHVFATYPTGRRSCPNSQELSPAPGGELALSPSAQRLLLTIELAQPAVALQVNLQRGKQAYSSIFRGGDTDDEAFAPCQDEEEQGEHHRGGFG